MRARSEKYPNLIISDLGIRFDGGEIEVTNPEHIARLRSLERLGVVVEDDPEPAKRGPGRPRKNP